MALLIYNPVAGDGTGKSFIDDQVIPLLRQHNVEIAQTLATENPNHAGEIALEFFQKAESVADIIIAGGDGTTHEVISEISLKAQKSTKINFVLIPTGTANALYWSLFPESKGEDPVAYKLRGIHAFINKQSSRPIPLTLAITSILAPPGNNNTRPQPKIAVSAVVTSTSLHASILHDSEALRADIPSIERFKVAAAKNITKWYKSFVKLLPSHSSGLVEIYNPSTKEFVPHSDSDHDDPVVDLDGPFAYFLSTVNADRLESLFRVSPLITSSPGTGAYMDVVVIRPLRDPSVHLDSPESRAAFAQKAGAVLGGVYQDGNHVNLRYDPEGKVVSEGDGTFVVEYFRCGGWEWEPDDEDDAAHLLCTDGVFHNILLGGKAVCTAAAPDSSSGFIVYVEGA